MKIYLWAALFYLFSMTGFAKSPGHHAHVHGHANLNIAFEDLQSGEVQMVVPAESIYGFEYEPKTDAEKKVQTDGLQKLETKIGSALAFNALLECKFSKKSISVQAEADEPGHREVHADFQVKCARSVAGTVLKFHFGKVFPRIKEVKGALLMPSGQSAIDIDDDQGSAEL